MSRSGYWLERSPSPRSVKSEALSKLVRQSFIDSGRTYDARRVWRDVLASGVNCGLHVVEKPMRRQALRARPRPRGLPSRAQRHRRQLLDRQFTADAPNQKWIADFTYIWTAEGWLYVAVVLDLYSHRAVGWSMRSSMTSQLVADALMMAVWRRGKPAASMHHSDQSSHTPAGTSRLAQGTGHHLQHEPRRRGLGQLGDGELLQFDESPTHRRPGLSDPRGG